MNKKFLYFCTFCLWSVVFAQEDDQTNNGVTFCYYSSWVNGRTGIGRFGVSDLPTDLCTHIIYSFLGLTSTGDLVYPFESVLEGKSNAVQDLIALKHTNSNLKILVAIGGWNEGSINFSTVVHDEVLRATFVNNLLSYVESNGFDGLDLDWEYPGQREGAETDKEQFVVLVRELKVAFEARGYLLTAAVGVTQYAIDVSYDVSALNEHLDYIHLMTYDYHGSWETVTGVNAPLYPQLTDVDNTNLNVNHSVNAWITNGASPSKLVLGLGAYGRTYTLASASDNGTGALANGAGVPGPFTSESGIWSFYEICQDQFNNAEEWGVTEINGNYVFANKGTFWVGYDNENTIYAKAQYAKSMGMAGIMYWAADFDDFSGICGSRYPLVTQGIEGFNAPSNANQVRAYLFYIISVISVLYYSVY